MLVVRVKREAFEALFSFLKRDSPSGVRLPLALCSSILWLEEKDVVAVVVLFRDADGLTSDWDPPILFEQRDKNGKT